MTHIQHDTKSLSSSRHGDGQEGQIDNVTTTFNVSELKESLEATSLNLESQKLLIEKVRVNLSEAKGKFNNAKLADPNQIHAKIGNLQQNIEAKNNEINVLNVQLDETNHNLGEAEKHRGSIREDDYKYTEWHYTNWWEGGGRQWLIARFSGHYPPPWPESNFSNHIRIHAKGPVDKISDFYNPQVIDPRVNHWDWSPNLTDLIFRTHYSWRSPGVYCPKAIIIINPFDYCRYNHNINEADANLNKAKAKKEEIEGQIKKLTDEVEKQDGQKVGFEEELRKLEEALKIAEAEKEKAEVKLQEALQEQKSLEARCSELQELISKEEAQVAKAASEAQDLKLAEAALKEVIELVKENGFTEENMKALDLKMEELLRCSGLEDYTSLREAQGLQAEAEDLQAEAEEEALGKNHQNEISSQNIEEGNFVYITGANFN